MEELSLEQKQSLRRVLFSGSCNESDEISDQDYEDSISLLKKAAETDTEYFLYETILAFENSVVGMTPVSMAILFSHGNDSVLSKNHIKNESFKVLVSMDAKDLLFLVEMLRSKVLGKGFGSRPQKWIKKAMEAWTPELIKKHMIVQPNELYALLRLVHPRYRDIRGEIVKTMLK